MVTEVRPEQPEKADWPILVTLLGMVMDIRPLQPPKACSPILVTLLGMVMEVRLEQPKKAHKPILVTLLGMTLFLQPTTKVLLAVSIMALQLFRESYFTFPDPTSKEVRPVQNSNILNFDNQPVTF
jgi:hypothetical protein